MKDYFKERHEIQQRDLPDKELREKLIMTQKVMQSKLDSENKKLNTDTTYKTDTIKAKTEDFNSRFRTKAQKKEEKLTLLKEQYANLQSVYVENLRTLEQEYDRIMLRTEGLEYKRDGESETFIDQILALKRRVKNYEDYIKRLKELVDKDRAEELILRFDPSPCKEIDELVEMKIREQTYWR